MKLGGSQFDILSVDFHVVTGLRVKQQGFVEASNKSFLEVTSSLFIRCVVGTKLPT